MFSRECRRTLSTGKKKPIKISVKPHFALFASLGIRKTETKRYQTLLAVRQLLLLRLCPQHVYETKKNGKTKIRRVNRDYFEFNIQEFRAWKRNDNPFGRGETRGVAKGWTTRETFEGKKNAAELGKIVGEKKRDINNTNPRGSAVGFGGGERKIC